MTTTMTPARTTTATSTPGTTRADGLADALDRVAAAVGQAPDDAGSRAVLAVLVQRLEDAAGVGLGEADGDPLVVLQRRFGRAHARLAARRAADVDADLLRGLASALLPQPDAGARAAARPVAGAALACC